MVSMLYFFQPPDPYGPLSLFHAIVCSLIPLLLIFFNQPFTILGILGMPTSWWDVLTLDLDLDGLISEGKFISAFGTLLALVRPTIPGVAPGWLRSLFPVVAWFFFSDEASIHEDPSSADSPESFFYVNGICTTRRMALATGAELAGMFNKSFTVVHNPTDSALIDLVECILEKLWAGKSWSTSHPSDLLFQHMMDALTDTAKTKVVLIAHSQGTIIAGEVLWRLREAIAEGKLPQDAMKKLEMYNLANVAHWMFQDDGFPYIESICNQRDTVGMLGANAPSSVKKIWNIEIAGEVIYPTSTRWGHLISTHYLKHLKNGDYPASKLHMYIKESTAPEAATS